MSNPTAALDGTTLNQLLSDDENRLLDAIDELRSQGIGKLLGDKGLPQIIVCGDQSSGKSSVLEALTRVRFPTKSSVCTTFPTELRLRREPRSQISCRIKPATSRTVAERDRLARFQESFDSPERFPDLITAARKCMSETSEGSSDVFFDDVLEVEIIGPKLAPLTVVDLPGIIHYRNASSAERDIKLVSTLVESYMKQDNSIILAVVSAQNDINNQTVLTRIKSIIPSGHRTLGIITKPDELPSGSEKELEFLDYAKSNPMKFQYGWHVVRNRNYQEQSSSFQERDEKEQKFFRDSNWNSVREVGLGIDSLRQKLSRMLLDHITLSLPSIVDQLETDLRDTESGLQKLGKARNSAKDQLNYLSDISDSFGEYTRDALDGRYRRGSFFGDPLAPEGLEKRLRANIRNFNDEFASRMLEQGHKWHIVEDSESGIFKSRQIKHPNVIGKSAFLKDHVDTLAYQERANELPGISNPLLVGSLFQQQSEPWEAIASDHLNTVWKAVKEFLETLLAHLTDQRTCDQLLMNVIDPAMEDRRRLLEQKLEELLVPHRDHDPVNIDPQFARKAWAMREKRMTTSIVEAVYEELKNKASTATPLPSVDQIMAKITSTNPLVGNKYGSLETLEFMQAYYETTILVFINNVASLAVEQCLLISLPKIFSASTVRGMDDEKLALIASESRDTLNDRVRLSERAEVLRKGLQIIKRIRPATRTIRSTVRPKENVPTANLDTPSRQSGRSVTPKVGRRFTPRVKLPSPESAEKSDTPETLSTPSSPQTTSNATRNGNSLFGGLGQSADTPNPGPLFGSSLFGLSTKPISGSSDNPRAQGLFSFPAGKKSPTGFTDSSRVRQVSPSGLFSSTPTRTFGQPVQSTPIDTDPDAPRFDPDVISTKRVKANAGSGKNHDEA